MTKKAEDNKVLKAKFAEDLNRAIQSEQISVAQVQMARGVQAYCRAELAKLDAPQEDSS